MNASLKSFTDTENVNLKSKISALEFELGTLREGYLKKETEQNLKITELETKLANIEKESEMQITRLNRDLSELNIELNATKEKLAVAQNRVVELADKVPTVDQVATIEKMSKEITELSSELEYKNIVLQKKSEEFDNLLEENKKLQEENKCIPIYKTQVRCKLIILFTKLSRLFHRLKFTKQISKSNKNKGFYNNKRKIVSLLTYTFCNVVTRS